jgi:predicted permease
MVGMYRLRLWFRALVARRRVERELAREMEFHVAMETEQLIKRGLTPDEARRGALVEFGGVERFKEAVRDERGLRLLDDLATDLRLVARSLRKRPGFALVVVMTLAVGIGASTAVFSWANWILLRPVSGVFEPNRVVTIGFWSRPRSPTGLSYPNYIDLRAMAPGFHGLVGHQPTNLQLGGGDAPPAELTGDIVVGDYFGVLGVRPQIGRFFAPEELTPGAARAVVVISDGLWRSQFGAAQSVVGRTVTINAITFTVIGVATADFSGTTSYVRVDAWLPYPMYTATRHRTGPEPVGRELNDIMELVGRLRPGITPSVAEAQVRLAMAKLVAAYPVPNERYATSLAAVDGPIGMPSSWRKQAAASARLLFGIVVLVLLIACANTANLLLFRGVGRRGEVAVRRALGASTSRLVRQHLVEGITFSLLAAVAGVIVMVWIAGVFARQPLSALPSYERLEMDWRVFMFAISVCFTTGVIFGIVPAVPPIRTSALAHLKESGRSNTGTGRRVRATLTVVQIGGSMTLVIAALLLARTTYNLNHVDLGFDPHGLFAFIIDPSPQGYPPARVDALRRHLLDNVPAHAAVAAASLASSAICVRLFPDRSTD